MKVCLNIILTITVCLCSFSYLFAEDNYSISSSIETANMEELADIDEVSYNKSEVSSEEVPLNNGVEIANDSIDNANAVYYSADKNYGQEIIKRYMDKDDILGYLDSPVLSPFSSMIAGNTLTTYALPYYGNITYYGDQNSPLSRFSTGITRFTTKSMAIFDKEGDNTLLYDDVSNILLNSLLGYFTGNMFGLNIWSSTDIAYTSGFEAIVKPFRNMQFSYSYMSERNINYTTFQFKLGYNSNGNLAVINMHSFSDNMPVNTTTGVEWQFYF